MHLPRIVFIGFVYLHISHIRNIFLFMQSLKISVVTVSYNAAATIEETILSVVDQNKLIVQ